MPWKGCLLQDICRRPSGHLRQVFRGMSFMLGLGWMQAPLTNNQPQAEDEDSPPTTKSQKSTRLLRHQPPHSLAAPEACGTPAHHPNPLGQQPQGLVPRFPAIHMPPFQSRTQAAWSLPQLFPYARVVQHRLARTRQISRTTQPQPSKPRQPRALPKPTPPLTVPKRVVATSGAATRDSPKSPTAAVKRLVSLPLARTSTLVAVLQAGSIVAA